MKLAFSFTTLFILFSICSAEIYYSETFDKDWADRWVYSTELSPYGLELCPFVWNHHPYAFIHDIKDRGLMTDEESRHYAISSKFPKAFSNKDKDLVLSYVVTNTQSVHCGGTYLKFMSSSDLEDQTKFNSNTPYRIMFGPDRCGGNERIQAILTYKDINYPHVQQMNFTPWRGPQVWTFVIHPDLTYEIYKDWTVFQSGDIAHDFQIFGPEEIEDPAASKPEGWVDEPTMPDPEAVKPAGWDDILPFIIDPEAVKPADWDDEFDGDWEAPEIANPDFTGQWIPPRIPNPNYIGPWVHPIIKNPDYKVDPLAVTYDDLAYVGIEVWQVLPGSVFDNIIVCDSFEEAKKFTEANIDLAKINEIVTKIEEEKNEQAKIQAEQLGDDHVPEFGKQKEEL